MIVGQFADERLLCRGQPLAVGRRHGSAVIFELEDGGVLRRQARDDLAPPGTLELAGITTGLRAAHKQPVTHLVVALAASGAREGSTFVNIKEIHVLEYRVGLR